MWLEKKQFERFLNLFYFMAHIQCEVFIIWICLDVTICFYMTLTNNTALSGWIDT